MPRPELPPLPDDIVAMLNAGRAGYNLAIGLEFVSVTYDRLECRVPVEPNLLQPYGLVHGGVYCSIVETMASAGAAINVANLGLSTVGLENNTSFLSATRSGVLRAVSVPLSRGRRSQVWEVTITNDAGKVAAKGKVRMICLETGSNVGGEGVGLKET